MIQKALKELAKQIFWLLAIILVLSIPIMLFVAPVLEGNMRLGRSMSTSTEIYAVAAMVGFTLIVVGVVVF